MKDKLPIALFDTLEHLAASQHEALSLNTGNLNNWRDFQLARQFILSYRGSIDTFNAYRRELERLLQWASLIVKKPLTDIRRQDFENYLAFCQKPPLAWIGLKQVARFIEQQGKRIPNPAWKPFVAANGIESYQLSKKAFRQIMVICSSFFNFLVQEGVTEVNPVLQIRQKNKFLPVASTKLTVIRRLSELQWSYVIETAELMATENPGEHERTLFIMNALYGMYLRISELTATPRWEPQMKDFYRDNDGNWWFITVGKGNKQRQIAVSDNMLQALKRYRISLNLSPLPSPHEAVPLISKNHQGRDPIASTRRIRGIVQICFDRAISRLQNDGFMEDADALKNATVHWLRHTGISEDVKFRPREHVRDDAGHSSSAITDRYIDVELRARHASARKKTINPDLMDNEQ